jgi:hypothetical protein
VVIDAEPTPGAWRRGSRRSEVTNGSAVLPDVDGRSTWVRRLRDLVRLSAGEADPDARHAYSRHPLRRWLRILT